MHPQGSSAPQPWLQCPPAWAGPALGDAQVWGRCLLRFNEQDERGLLPWWGWEEFGPWTGAMPHHLGLCPLFVYNYRCRKMRNCSQFLSKNMGNHWFSTTYLDPLYFIFLLHLPILHYHLCNLEECRDQFKIH